jgi:hypothetical protein
MGDCAKDKVVSLLNALNRVCFRRRGGSQDVESKAEAIQS